MPVESTPFGRSLTQTWLYKFRRAEEHSVAVNQAIQWFINQGPCENVDEFNTETLEHRIIVKSISPIPLPIRLIVADAIGNYRASLDHCWTAVLAHFDAKPTSRTQFPIFHSEPKTKNALQAWTEQLGPVPKPCEAIVKRLQPYAGGNATEHPLFHLNELVRRDKHQTLNLMVMRSAGPQLHGPEGGLAVAPLERVEPGAVLMEYGPDEMAAIGAYKPGTKPGGPKVEVRFYERLSIGFEQPPAVAGREIVATLQAIHDQVADVFQNLSGFFPPQPPKR